MPLPYPMRLGRKPVAIAMMASIIATRMAAANISSFMAQSPPMAGALCQLCTSPPRHLHHSRVAGGVAEPSPSRADSAAMALRPMRNPQGSTWW